VLSVAVHPLLAGDWILARSSLNVFPRDVSPILCLHLMLCVYYGWESVHARGYRKGTDGAVVSLCFFKRKSTTEKLRPHPSAVRLRAWRPRRIASPSRILPTGKSSIFYISITLNSLLLLHTMHDSGLRRPVHRRPGVFHAAEQPHPVLFLG
jgi:hypothetical protein